MSVKFYTNVYSRGDKVYLRGYSHDNRRVQEVIDYKPYLFSSNRSGKNTKYRTLDGRPVDRIDFESIGEARDFVKRYSDVSNMEIFGLTNFRYLYIYDKFGQNLEYDPSWVNVISLDIETRSDSGFPNINTADKEITAITISRKGEKVVLGCGDFTPHEENIQYIKCKDEWHLLNNFLKIWQSGRYSPDVLTGWNIEFFDLPYLVNRITNQLGLHEAKKLSPWGILDERTVEIHGKEQQTYVPAGINILDYLALYKKFKFEQQESYKLENIAEVEELNTKKLDYKSEGYTDLEDLYKRNYQLFLEYNCADVAVVDLLEEKLKFIEQVMAFAYDAKVNYNDVMATVLPWDIIIHNYLMDRAIVIPKDRKHVENRPIPGGFVKEVKPGMYNWVVSFDLTSLYPSLIMGWNISPEVKVGKEQFFPPVSSILNGYAVIEDQNVAYAANGVKFSKEKQGFLAALMDRLFTDRAEYKKSMLQAKKELEALGENATELDRRSITNRIAKYHNLQLAKKVQLNSGYGALANQHFRWFDPDLAEAITLSGQLAVQWVARDINIYLNKLLKTGDVDRICGVDTDSNYIVLDDLVKMLGTTDRDKILNALDQFCEVKLQPVINKSFENLCATMYTYENRLHMKRETIANKAIWKARKMYIMNALDIEGVRFAEPKLKVTGIEAVRSSTPKACRKSIKEALKIIMNEGEDTTQEYISDFKQKFMSMKFSEVAFPRGMNGMAKYADPNTIYSKGTPIHVRGALMYNHLLKKLDLESKYEQIGDGDKIKFCYLTLPNSIGEYVISVLDDLPPEFDLEKYIDYETQFEKTFLDPIRNILECIGWQHEKIHTLEGFFS
jgi:DNA polymerase elongation subunit (family B)